MLLRQAGFTWSTCGKKERIQKFEERGNVRYIHQNELDKCCFQHNMTDGDFKDLHRRTASIEKLRDKAFNIGKNRKFEKDLASIVYKYLKLLVKVLKTKSCKIKY